MSSTTPTRTVHAAARSRTPVGVDLGEKTLVAVAPEGTATEDVLTVDGEPVRESFRLLRQVCNALQQLPGDTDHAETAVVAAFWHRLKGQAHDAAARALDVVQAVDDPLLVLEDIDYAPRPLWGHRTDRDQIGTWLLPVLHEALVERAADAGVPVTHVNPEGTSQECHRCGERGERAEWGDYWFRCTTENCPVGGVDGDVNAALTIAERATASAGDVVDPVTDR